MVRRKREYRIVSLKCRGCIHINNSSRKFDGNLYADGCIKSQGLTRHIKSDNFQCCKQYYVAHCGWTEDKPHYDRRSVVGPIPTVQKKVKYTHDDLGVSVDIPSQSSGNQNAAASVHRSINNYTLYHPHQHLSRNTITSILDKQSTEPKSNVLSHNNDGLRSTNSGNGDDRAEPDTATTNSDKNFDADDDDGTNVVVFNDDDSEGSLGGNVFVDKDEHSPHENAIQVNDHNQITEITFTPPTMIPSGQLSSEIKLMDIIRHYKIPLASYDAIFNWARTCQMDHHVDFSRIHTRKRETVLKDLRLFLQMPDDDFQPQTIRWLPSNRPTEVYIRSFKTALFSLLTNTDIVKEGNFSFPDPNSPFISAKFPSEPNGETEIRELHHGKWWVQSWKQSCQLDVDEHGNSCSKYKEILVPIILYMDGISLDAHGRLSLTPLNMTLGIFNVKTRRRADAWETLYFHPSSKVHYVSQCQKKRTSGVHNIQNLHNGLQAALQSFHDVCTKEDGILWDGLPYAGKVHKVKMKFAIAYVIGDTELHDQLCGKFKCYSGVSRPCRHCNVADVDLVDPKARKKSKLWIPSDFSQEKGTESLKAVSHHPIHNAFDRLQFGANNHKIHFATPAELLHQHQLGAAKRAVESLEANAILGDKNTVCFQKIQGLSHYYGCALTRQSDRDFPQTKFSSSYILSPAMKEGKHYGAILLCFILAVVSRLGRDTWTDDDHISSGMINLFEDILAMEEFLKNGVPLVKDIPNLDRKMDKFVKKITKFCHRSEGAGNRLLKNHLYFHLAKYIELWGPPCGWDSSFSESHHKTEIKAPSRNTQRQATKLIRQTATRQVENRLIKRAVRIFNLKPNKSQHSSSMPNSRPDIKGARFIIKKNELGSPIMEWADTRNEKTKTTKHAPFILKFCCDRVLPLVSNNQLEGCTEHHRLGFVDGTQFIFRCHPSYRSNSGQVCDRWYDWAVFSVESKSIPCQIFFFLI